MQAAQITMPLGSSSPNYPQWISPPVIHTLVQFPPTLNEVTIWTHSWLSEQVCGGGWGERGRSGGGIPVTWCAGTKDSAKCLPMHWTAPPLQQRIPWIKMSVMPSLRVSEVAQSCPTLCDHMGCSPPGSSGHGIFQARILEWVAISFSRGSSRPRDWTQVSRIVGRHFTVWATGEVLVYGHQGCQGYETLN